MIHRLLCSTGAMIGRPNGRDWRLLTCCAEKLRCDGLEFMMYDSWYGREQEILSFLRGLPLPVPAMHCEKGVGEMIGLGREKEALEEFGINCRMARALGAEKMVLHLWNGVTSDRRFDRCLAAYPALLAMAEDSGVLLTVENVVCSAEDPISRWRELAALYPGVRFTYDTKMAAFHAQTESMYECRDRWPHIAHLHLNDYAGGYRDWNNLRTLHPGEGTVDFDRLFAFLREIGYDGDCTVEATSFDRDGVIHWEKLNATLDRLRGWIGEGR